MKNGSKLQTKSPNDNLAGVLSKRLRFNEEDGQQKPDDSEIL